MQYFIIPLIAGLFAGIVAAVCWALFWTVVIPWEEHTVFYTIVFIVGGFGGAALSLRGMLS
jgi:drug/metabolite transporter (DMT)-like permease